jgi:Holliday junction resolvase
MPAARESAIERAVCAKARREGHLVLKLSAPGYRGQPDRMFLKDGKACFIEFKAPGKKPTALQMKWMNDLTDAGFRAACHDNVEEALTWLNTTTP